MYVAMLACFAAPVLGQQTCNGDCNSDGRVTISELIRAVNASLLGDLSYCRSVDSNLDGAVSIAELVRAVNQSLFGCPVPSLTQTPTLMPAPTATATVAINTLIYRLSGTLNDQPATGRMVLLPIDPPLPNLLLYDVVLFEFGNLEGTGNLEFFTLTDTYTIELTLKDPEQNEVEAVGTAPLTSEFPFLPGEFNVSGDGQTLVFTVAASG